MEEKRSETNRNDDKNSPIYTVLILLGMILISYLSLFVPVIIILILFLLPVAFEYDLKSGKPILSIGTIIIIGLFLYFNKFDYSLYMILVIITGFSVLSNYIIWRYFKAERFEDGLLYSILLSITFGMIVAFIIFVMGDRQSFSLQILRSIEEWILNSKSEFVNSNIALLYNYDAFIRDTNSVNVFAFTESLTGAVDYGSGLTKVEKLAKVMPYIEDAVNRYSISAMVLYPSITGVITWWRGNFRFYKKAEITKDIATVKPKPFSTFNVPRRFFGIIAIMLISSFFLQSPSSSNVTLNATYVIQDIAYMILGIQGLAVMEYFLKRAKAFKSGVSRIIIMVAVSIISLGGFPVFLGAVDLFINIRFVYAKTKEINEKVKSSVNNQEVNEKKDDDTN